MILPDFDAARERFRELRRFDSPFYDRVDELRSTHMEGEKVHHNLEHDIQVALNCLAFAPDPHTGDMAWTAALCHSMDWWLERDENGDVNEAEWEQMVREALARMSDPFRADECDTIVRAVLRHHKLNQDDDSVVQQVLQDADRIGNLTISTAFRIGRGYPDLPLISPRDFPSLSEDTDYNHPWSCLNDFENCLHSYRPQFRTEGAKVMCAQVFEPILQQFLAAMREQHGKYGIVGFEP